MRETILDVRHMSVAFRQYKSGFRQTELAMIRDLSLSVHAGELVAVIGASGSGKSLLAHGILGILPYNARLGGDMLFRGKAMTQKRKEALRGREIALVPQSVSYLDPLMKVGPQLTKGSRDQSAGERAMEILARFGLADRTKNLYPFELSGGMARRVLISTAVLERPALVIADEPTPGLHEDVARMVLRHFREMADDGAGVLLITHDLELALDVADRVVVLYAGASIEEAAAVDFVSPDTLRHPYTRALWHAMPKNGFHAISGSQPSLAEVLAGCAFAPCCAFRAAACAGDIPWREVRGGYVRCVRAEDAL